MAIGDWSALVLCNDTDLARFESNVLEWVRSQGTAKHWRDTAKRLIGNRLRSDLRDTELATDEADVLDLISNPEVLTDAASFLALNLIATDKMVHPGDTWAAKAVAYQDKFDQEFPVAVSMLHVDKDESGAIDDTEKYNVTLGVRFTRGG